MHVGDVRVDTFFRLCCNLICTLLEAVPVLCFFIQTTYSTIWSDLFSIESVSTDTSTAAQTATPTTDVMDKTLNKDDATDIVRRLLDLQSKAKTLGRLLKLPKAIIDVTPQPTSDPQAPLFFVIGEFLKQVEPRPTWRFILNTLRDPLIGEHSLAQEIEISLTGNVTSPVTPSSTTVSQSSATPQSSSASEVQSSTTVPLTEVTAVAVSQSSTTSAASETKSAGAYSGSPGNRLHSIEGASRPAHHVVGPHLKESQSRQRAKPVQRGKFVLLSM